LKQHGNSAEYHTARIARDHPDILARMKAGEFSSVRQAALEAGIIRPPIYVPRDPVKAAVKLKAEFHGVELAALIEELTRSATP
jgi:hypothetical protein